MSSPMRQQPDLRTWKKPVWHLLKKGKLKFGILMADCVHAISNIYIRMIELRFLRHCCFQEFRDSTGDRDRLSQD